jgi:Kinesin motor domain
MLGCENLNLLWSSDIHFMNQAVHLFSCWIHHFGKGYGVILEMIADSPNGTGLQVGRPRPVLVYQLYCSFQGCEFTVRVSFLEIYNEELIDLLGAESVENPRLKIYEDNVKKV